MLVSPVTVLAPLSLAGDRESSEHGCLPRETGTGRTDRAASRGYANVDFIQSDVDHLPFGADFDAIVGRVVLMYRRNPAADLRALVRFLKPGGWSFSRNSTN